MKIFEICFLRTRFRWQKVQVPACESLAERSKIERETVINYGGVTKAGATAVPAAVETGAVNELLVVPWPYLLPSGLAVHVNLPPTPPLLVD